MLGRDQLAHLLLVLDLSGLAAHSLRPDGFELLPAVPPPRWTYRCPVRELRQAMWHHEKLLHLPAEPSEVRSEACAQLVVDRKTLRWPRPAAAKIRLELVDQLVGRCSLSGRHRSEPVVRVAPHARQCWASAEPRPWRCRHGPPRSALIEAAGELEAALMLSFAQLALRLREHAEMGDVAAKEEGRLGPIGHDRAASARRAR